MDGKKAETDYNGLYYRELEAGELSRALFAGFERRQVVTKCYRKIDGRWQLKDAPFIDDWSEEDYHVLQECLRRTLLQGGVIYGAFAGGVLKGFCSVEGELIGSRREYLDLTSLHVSRDYRDRGIGKKLFSLAAGWAAGHGGKKLYISGHSAAETQAFYQAMGCREAEEYQQGHVEREPFDCQLEYVLPRP